jgi:deazaflavin-dependent oxidoreductase (nitroreductase family)
VLAGGVLAVLGTNFGGPRTPAWVFNLRARPEAVLVHGGREIAVRARLLAGAERERVLAAARRTYRGYALYQRRAAHREICVFALEPMPRAAAGEPPG